MTNNKSENLICYGYSTFIKLFMHQIDSFLTGLFANQMITEQYEANALEIFYGLCRSGDPLGKSKYLKINKYLT